MVLQLSRLSDGSRKVLSIAEVTGMEGDIILMQEIFRFDRQGVDPDGKVIGEMKPLGVRPKFAEILQARGIHMPAELFDPYRRKTG